jgi:O-antigen ligase/Flp pilus assembly protein TadD
VARQRQQKVKHGRLVEGRDAAVSDPIIRVAQLLIVAKIALVVYTFYPPAADAFALTKSVVSHSSAFAVAGVLLAIGIRDRRLFAWSPIHIAVLALVCTFALSTVFALDQTIALFGAWRRYLGLDQMLDHAVLFLGVATVFRTRADRGRLAVALIAIAVPVCVYALLQWSGHDFVQYVQAPGTRPLGTFGQPDTAGAFFGVVTACALAAAFWPWARWGIALRALAGVLAIVAVSVGYATGTRGTFLGVVGGLAGFAVIVLIGQTRFQTESKRATVVVAAGALLMALTLVLVAPALAPVFQGSGESRLEIWQTALRAVAGRPLLGVGPDNFAAAYPSLHDIRAALLSPGELQNSTHNAALYVATSAGLLGLLAWAAMLVLAIVRAVSVAASRDPDALVLVLIGAYLGQALVTITDLGLEWMPFVAAGLAAASWVERPQPNPAGRKQDWGALSAFGVVTLIAFVLLSQAQLSRLTASEAIAAAEALRANGHPLAAIDYARQALQVDNRRAEHWSIFATALNDAGNPGAARSGFEEATQRQPWNPLYWQNIALTYLAQGDEVHALAAIDRAIAADPYSARSRDLAARFAFNKGAWDRALMEGTMAVRIDPTNLDEYEAPVRAAIHLQDWQQAEALLRTGLVQRETAHFHVLLALVYADSGRHADAVSEVTRALALAPGDPEATQLQQQIGQP